MPEALFILVGVIGCFAFAPRIGIDKVGPRGRFPWVDPGLRVSDWSLGGAFFVMLPFTLLVWHTPLRPMAWITGAFTTWVLWAWVVSAWRRQ